MTRSGAKLRERRPTPRRRSPSFKWLRPLAAVVFILVAASGLPACDGDSPSDVPPSDENPPDDVPDGLALVIEPSPVFLTVGTSYQLSAFVEDDEGGQLEVTQDVTWGSDDPSVAMISSGGLVEAVSEGMTQITAEGEADGVSLDTETTITVRPPGEQVEGGPNEPVDFAPVVGRTFDSKATSNGDEGSGSFPFKTGGSEGWDDHEAEESLITVQADVDSPLSPTSVLRFEYPAQTVESGTSFTPGQVQTKLFQNSNSGLSTPASFTEIYNRFTIKLGPNFQVNDNSGFTKIVFYRSYDGGSISANGPYLKIGTQGATFDLEWDLQGTEDNARILSASGDNTMDVDTWYEVEVLLRMNDAPGTANGEVHTWLMEHPGGTRVKIFEATDVLLRAADDGGSNAVFTGIRHDPVWGGQGGTIDPTFYWYLGHHWVSAKE